MSIRLPTVSLGVQVPQATPYVCCLVLLLVLALSLKGFFPGDSGFPLKCMSVMACGNGWRGYLALDL